MLWDWDIVPRDSQVAFSQVAFSGYRECAALSYFKPIHDGWAIDTGGVLLAPGIVGPLTSPGSGIH